MRILMVHNDYAKFSGEENAVRVMGEVLESHGHSLSWFRRSSEEIGDSTARKAQAFFSGIYSVTSRKKMEQILARGQIDIVQVQNLYPFISPSVLPVCKARNIPVVMRCPNYRLFCPNGLHLSRGQICERCLGGREWHCVLRNCENNLPKSIGYAARNAFARITRMITDSVTVFIVLSEFQKQRFVDGGIPAEKIAILPNVASTDSGHIGARDGETVSFVGRVSAEKGIYQFLDAARHLSELPFAVAGSTNALPGIRTDAPANVKFAGFLTGSEFADFYNNSRILVFPSIWFEGFPNVIAKAMASGKPVVASRLGAIPEIVDDGVTGLLFEPGNSCDLSEKIATLWNDPQKCREMGAAARFKAQREYSPDNYYRKLMDAYQTAIDLSAGSTA